MKITRYQDQYICLNHQLLAGIHALSLGGVIMHIYDPASDQGQLRVIKPGEELAIEGLDTVISIDSVGWDGAGQRCITLDIQAGEGIEVHRAEIRKTH